MTVIANPNDAIPSEVKMMVFAECIEKLLIGEKITRLDWADEKVYGVMREKLLMIMAADGQFHTWTVHEEDLRAGDWVVVR